jgi:hypothetical protein
MANKLRGEVTVKAGGDSVTLRPTFDAILQVEDALDKDILSIARGMDDGSLRTKDLLAVCLECAEDKDKAKAVLSKAGWPKVRLTAADLLRNMLSGGDDEKKAEPSAPTESTGPST